MSLFRKFVRLLIIISLLTLAYKVYFDKPDSLENIKTEIIQGDDAPSILNQDELGDSEQVMSAQEIEKNSNSSQAEQVLSYIVTDMIDCLDLKMSQPPASVSVKINDFLSYIESQFAAAQSFDRWENWHLKNRQGEERRIRVEMVEDETGKIIRELSFYSIDRENLPVPIELENHQTINPNDEVIGSLLKQGEVFFREKASTIVFKNNDRLEYVEKNGTLDEFHFYKENRIFRCSSIAGRENCNCVR